METILVIEDDKNMRDTLEEFLQMNGYRVLVAANGRSGLELVMSRQPDLIISDISMPKLNGIGLMNALRDNEFTRQIPVIFISARTTQQDRLAGFRSGVDGYLNKPFSMDELLLKTNNLLERRRMWYLDGQLGPAARPHPQISQEEKFLTTLRAAMEKHMANPKLEVDQLAKECNMSLSNLQKKVRKVLDKSLTQVLREYRLKRGRDLLVQDVGNVSEIAQQVGFGSLSYFSTRFKEYFGHPPTKLSGD